MVSLFRAHDDAGVKVQGIRYGGRGGGAGAFEFVPVLQEARTVKHMKGLLIRIELEKNRSDCCKGCHVA